MMKPAEDRNRDDLPRAVDHEEEREDGAENDVVELPEVARPDVTPWLRMNVRQSGRVGECQLAHLF